MKEKLHISLVGFGLLLATLCSLTALFQAEVKASSGIGVPAAIISTANQTTLKNMTNTTSLTNVLDVSAGKDVTFQLDAAASAACTSNLFMIVYTSVDGVTYNAGEKTVTLALAGTTPINLVTNMSLGAVQWLKVKVYCDTITNVVVTNLTVKAAVK